MNGYCLFDAVIFLDTIRKKIFKTNNQHGSRSFSLTQLQYTGTHGSANLVIIILYLI